MTGPKSLTTLIKELTKLPGIGGKTAERLAFHLLKNSDNSALKLADAISVMIRSVRLCSECFAISESDFCDICKDEKRDKETVLVVEDPMDLISFEKMDGYRGLYHVLMGTIKHLDGIGPESLRIDELVKRLRLGKIREVILATNPTTEGETTAMYIAKLVQSELPDIKLSRIASGIPVGGDIEYADEVTLYKSVSGRIAI